MNGFKPFMVLKKPKSVVVKKEKPVPKGDINK